MTRNLFIRDAVWPVSTEDRDCLEGPERREGLTYLAIEASG